MTTTTFTTAATAFSRALPMSGAGTAMSPADRTWRDRVIVDAAAPSHNSILVPAAAQTGANPFGATLVGNGPAAHAVYTAKQVAPPPGSTR